MIHVGMGKEDELHGEVVSRRGEPLHPEIGPVEVGAGGNEPELPQVGQALGAPRLEVLLEVQPEPLVVDPEIEEEPARAGVEEDLRPSDRVRSIEDPELHGRRIVPWIPCVGLDRRGDERTGAAGERRRGSGSGGPRRGVPGLPAPHLRLPSPGGTRPVGPSLLPGHPSLRRPLRGSLRDLARLRGRGGVGPRVPLPDDVREDHPLGPPLGPPCPRSSWGQPAPGCRGPSRRAAATTRPAGPPVPVHPRRRPPVPGERPRGPAPPPRPRPARPGGPPVLRGHGEREGGTHVRALRVPHRRRLTPPGNRSHRVGPGEGPGAPASRHEGTGRCSPYQGRGGASGEPTGGPRISPRTIASCGSVRRRSRTLVPISSVTASPPPEAPHGRAAALRAWRSPRASRCRPGCSAAGSSP